MNKSVHVVHVIDSLTPGGAERVMVDLVNHLPREDIDITVCTTRYPGTWIEQLKPDIRVIDLKRKHTLDLKGINAFRNALKSLKINLIHSHMRSSCQFVALAALGKRKIGHIFHDHFGRIDEDQSCSRSLSWILKHHVDRYLGVSHSLVEWAQKKVGLPEAKTKWLGNAILSAEIEEGDKKNKDKTKFKIGIIANIREQKNHLGLIDAIKRCRNLKDIELHCIGKSTLDSGILLEKIKQKISDYGIEAHVIFHGEVANPRPLLKKMNAGVIASHSESGPLVILEYMVHQLPWISTDTGQILNEVRDSGSGIVVPRGNTQALAEAIDGMVEMNPEEALEMGRRGRARVLKDYNISDRCRELLEIYQEVMA